jgi:cytochrome P450
LFSVAEGIRGKGQLGGRRPEEGEQATLFPHYDVFVAHLCFGGVLVLTTAFSLFTSNVLIQPFMPSQIRDTFLGFIYTHPMKPVNDTTREALNILVVAALCFPDVLKHARDEVDAICSSPAQRDSDSESEVRLPTLADMNRMPYICATAKELLRWRPIFPLTPDHAQSAPISFEGYHFPAGTGFVINEVPVCGECDDPGEFKPERWLDGNEADIAHGLRQFGGGRHICVGYRLAQRSLFVNVARLVQPFDYESVRCVLLIFQTVPASDDR